jgi:hypothetical protein
MTRRTNNRFQTALGRKTIPDPATPNSTSGVPNLSDSKHTMPLRRLVGLLIVTVLVLVLGVTYFAFAASADPIPASIVKSVSFPLYHPIAAPAGYNLQKSTIKSIDGTVFYTLSNSQTKQSIQISQQPIPTGFNPQVMFSHNPLPSTISPLGTVYDLSFKGQSRFMIMAPKSLLFVSATPQISDALLQQIINGLKTSS